jgi:hypothetical protein
MASSELLIALAVEAIVSLQWFRYSYAQVNRDFMRASDSVTPPSQPIRTTSSAFFSELESGALNHRILFVVF